MRKYTEQQRIRRNIASKKWKVKNREHYLATCRTYKKKHRKRIISYKKVRYKQVRAFIWELKNKPCADCGRRFHPCAMDFDHVFGQKSFSLSQAHRTTLENVKREALKCEVVCSNCHRVRTFKRKKK